MGAGKPRGPRTAFASVAGSPVNLRDEGRVRVLRALQETRRSSRPELISRTGLSRATVATVVGNLIACGVVEEGGDINDGSRRAGRPAQSLSIVASAAYAAALDIGHSHVGVALCDASGRSVWERAKAVDVDHTPIQTLDLAAGLVEEALRSEEIPRERVLGLGVGIGHVGSPPLSEISRRASCRPKSW